MKNYFNYFRFLLVAIMLASAAELYADKTTETEGTSFWFAIPTARTGINEPTRGSAKGASEEVYITSKVDANVTIYSSSNSFSSPYKTVQVKANGRTIVTLMNHVQDTVGEKIETKKSYYVKSDAPISVVLYIAWYWTGEAFRIVPEDWLGTEYFTLNLYNDYCKMVDNGSGHFSTDGAYRDHPGQILIVATEDNTTVTYTPKAATRLVKAGESKTITMNKGNTYLILSKIDVNKRQADTTDLSGTRIVSDKKIAVYSGHTKGVFPKYNPNYYSLGSSSFSADFLRNMLFDSMWPVELLGKEYVTVPNMYDNEWHARDFQGLMEDERGDMIRLIATQDNTNIWLINDSGEEFPIAQRLKRGEKIDRRNQETPARFRANKPLLVGQYGKGWFYWESGKIHYKEGEDNNKEDEFQNPERAGQGMLYSVTPTEQWSNYAGFISVAGVNNHINLIFYTGDEEKIVYREGSSETTETIKQRFGGDIREIPGSKFSYIRAKVGPGNNSVESIDPTAKFAVYAYGNMDAHKDGFAYGYPTNVNYFTPCKDTIIVETSSECEIINGTITINDLEGDVSCAAIQNIRVDPITVKNAVLSRGNIKTGDKTGTFTIKFTNKAEEGYIKVTVLSKSGNSVTKEFTYSPELISADPATITFNKMHVGKPSEQKVKIKNPSAKIPLTIKRLYLKNEATMGDKIWISDPANKTDIVVPPNGETTVTITALLNTETSIAEELWAQLACYSQKLTVIKANSGSPIITIQDVPFGTKSISQAEEFSETKVFENKGSVSALITGFEMKLNSPNFRMECPELQNATPEKPLELLPNKEGGKPISFKVFYMPKKEANVDHKAILKLICPEANVEKFESVWTGRAVDADISITNLDWGTKRVIDQWSIDNGITKYSDSKTDFVTVKNEGTEKIKVTEVQRIKGTYDDGISTPEELYTGTELTLDDTAVNELIANGLNPGESKKIPVTFIPKDQLKYYCGLKVVGAIASTNSPKVSPPAYLKGIGKQPHVSTKDVDFGRLNVKLEQSKTMYVPFYAIRVTEVPHDDNLKIKGFSFVQNDNGCFAFESKFNPDTVITIPIGDTILVPVVFTPPNTPAEIDYLAQLKVNCDAPNTDDKVAQLKGRAFMSMVSTKGHDFAVTYKMMRSLEEGTVTFTNNGTVDIYISRPLQNSLMDLPNNSGHSAMFELTDKNYVTSDPSTTYPQMHAEPIRVPAGKSYVATIKFVPAEVEDYKAKIEFEYYEENPSNPTSFAEAVITGSGKEYLAECSIPKGYTAKPGEYIHLDGQNPGDGYAEFRLKPRVSDIDASKHETKPLSDASVTKFDVEFQFADDLLDLAKGIKHVYPLVNSNGLVDIVTANTMTSGWSVTVKPITDKKTLVVEFKNDANQALSSSNNDVLFKFRMIGYLSTPNELIELKPKFTPKFPYNQYFSAKPYSGDVKIEEVCIDNGRVVTAFGVKSGVTKLAPNPNTIGTSSIEFSVAINCPVTIEVFNSNGVKVTTLLNNEMKKPGTYKLEINPESLGLSSGTYSYRIEMGGFSETETFVIQR